MKFTFIVSALLSIISLAMPLSSIGAELESFSPQGTVKSPIQVMARFSTQIVPLGQPSDIQPFDIDCPVKGRSRWIDTKTWVYDFDEPLSSGIRCLFSLKRGMKDISGNLIQADKAMGFNTGGPNVVEAYPYEGSDNIDEQQVFILRLEGTVKRSSILNNAYCAVSGIGEKIPIKLLGNEEAERLLKALGQHGIASQDYVIALQCSRPLPNKTEVRLVWSKGIESPSGIATAQNQVFSYKTRDTFRAWFSCQRENAQSQCIPLLPLTLRFSAPVSWKDAQKVVLRSIGNKIYKPVRETSDYEEEGFIYLINFKGPFKDNHEYTIEVPKGLRDDSGRTLVNQREFPMKVRTGDFPLLAKFPARFGILESKAEPAIPLTVRGIEDPLSAALVGLDNKDSLTGRIMRFDEKAEERIIQWLHRTAVSDRRSSVFKDTKVEAKAISIPRPEGAKAFEVIGIPVSKPGFYVAEVQSRMLGSRLLGRGQVFYAPTAALVTNLSVHFKQGRDSSLVWVTGLQDGKPQPEAEITIRNCKGIVQWRGRTNSSGIAMINKPLPEHSKLPSCEMKQGEDTHYDYPQLGAVSEMGRGLFVFARTGEDISFVHTSWDKGIEPWRFNLRQAGSESPLKAHTVLDRTLFRAGETVHMTHLIRRLSLEGFSLAGRGELPEVVEISHQASDQRYEMPIKWDSNQRAEGIWKIPADARLGEYQIHLKKGAGGQELRLPSGAFRVEEFKVPLMRALIKPLKETLINPSEAELDLSVNYLSGGGAKGSPVRLRARIMPYEISFRGFEDFEFAKGIVKTGIEKRGRYYEEGEEGELRFPEVANISMDLDDHGSQRAIIKPLSKSSKAQKIHAELEFRDPNGEIQTASSQIPVYPSSVLLGIKPESWAASYKNVKLHVAATDTKGNPLGNVALKVEAYKKRYYSHRKRLIGGFYSYEHLTEVKRSSVVCNGKTDISGILTCEFTPSETGNLILQASANDSEGNEALTHSEVWIAGREEQWFDVSDSDRIDLISEKRRYETGETARFQIRMPFRDATALITVEREGIIDAFVKTLSGKDPILDLPIKKAYSPNVFVSALVVRGRVADIQPGSMIDLGKPAFRLGISELQIGWKEHEASVEVRTDKDRYKVREDVNVKIRVRAPDNRRIDRSKTSVTVAVVDEGLLELRPNKSWDILQAMMELRGYQVATSTASLQVVGKRHFGKKAYPQGGGGGRQITRELFDTLVYWNPSVPLNDSGEAELSFSLNDSVTSFRIAAVVNSDKDIFGSGFASIRSWQDMMIFSGLPKMVREGDSYRAAFTVRNASERTLNIDIRASTKDTTQGEKGLQPLEMVLASGESREAAWDINVPQGVDAMQWFISARDKDSGSEDRMRVQQKVYPLYSVKTLQGEFYQLHKPVYISLERPASAIAGKGGIEASLSRSIVSSLEGVTAYMQQYPYSCMEQKVSRAVSLKDRALWRSIMAEMPSYLDVNGLIKFFPTMSHGSDALTAYVLSIAHEAGLGVPEYILTRMQEGLLQFVTGKLSGYSPLQTSDLSLRRLSALEALSRYGKAEASHVTILRPDISIMPSSALIDWINVIIRIKDIPDRDKRYIEAVNSLNSRFVFHGTTAGLSTEKTDKLWWLMVSPDVNILRTVLTFAEYPEWKPFIARLMKGALARQKKGQWDSTTANAWGVLAVDRFVSVYESEPVSGVSAITAQGAQRNVNWTEKTAPKPLLFEWAGSKSILSAAHNGSGAPWLSVRSLAAVPVKEPIYSGYTIKKTYMPVEQKTKGAFRTGDLIKVRIEISANADMTWVVVKDPLPGGAVITKTGLSSDMPAEYGTVYPAFEEKHADSYRAYFELLPRGNAQIEYIMRLNTPGQFNMPETRVEALYSPDLYGEGPNNKFIVKP